MQISKKGQSHRRWSINFKFPRLVITLIGCVVASYLVLAGRAATLTPPPQSASEVDAQAVHFPSGSASIAAYLAKPSGTGKHPAVIVIHDDQGLTVGIKDLTRLFGRSGFVALAPDLVSHPGTAAMPSINLGFGVTPVGNLPVDQTVDDVRAAFAYLKQDASVDATKISAVGVGWGGWRAYKLAEDEPSLFRLVVFYGVTPDDIGASKIQIPVLAHYAQGDFLVTAGSLKTKQWLGEKFTYYIYPATDRGFFGGGSSGGLDLVALGGEADIEAAAKEKENARPGENAGSGAAAAGKLAWDRTLAFLGK